MSQTVVFEEQVEIPLNLRSLSDFRRWALSDDFPERGRVDYRWPTLNAEVPEFWLVDSRGDELLFQIHRRGKSQFEPVSPDNDGFQMSNVMACKYRLEREWDEELERWEFDLVEKR